MTTNGDVLIRVENLQKAFGDFHALNGITEEIHKGEVVVIIGPSGSRKIYIPPFPEPSGGADRRSYLF